jgi:hypothetical protein
MKSTHTFFCRKNTSGETLMVAVKETTQSSYKIDPSNRRMFERREIQARVQGTRLDHSIPARQQPHVSLALRDLSIGGLSAISIQPLEAGERVAVFFPPQGINRGWDAYGKIIRCDPSHFGYRVAVEFDPIAKAA